ncbi:MAG: hypothetical protein V7677_15970 [Motiliproteus sp.]
MNKRSELTPPSTFHPFSLTGKFISLFALFSIIAGTLLYSEFNRSLQLYSQQQRDSLGHSTSSQLALSSGPTILSSDWLSLNVSLNKLTEDPLILGAEVIGKKGQMLAQSGQPSDLLYNDTILSNEETLGHVRIYLSPQTIEQQASHPRRYYGAIMALCGGMLWLLVWLFSRHITRAISELNQAAKQLQHSNEISPLNNTRRDEFGTINRLLNNRFAVMEQPLVEATVLESETSTAEDSINDTPQHLLAETVITEETVDHAGEDNSAVTDESFSATLNNSTSAPELHEAFDEPKAITELASYLLYINQHDSDSDYLSTGERNQLLSIYQVFFEQACELYKGQLHQDGYGNWYALFDPISEDNSHGINALCAAQLFKGMYRATNEIRISELQPVLNLKICLVCGAAPTSIVEAHQLSQEVKSNDLISHQRLFDIEELHQKLIKDGQYKKVSETAYLLTSLCKDFQQLIDRQVKHFIG